MRIWSLHPKYLDAKGIVALWRETLLAKNVLEGKTKGYKNHSQLIRFKNCENPVSAINQYLSSVYDEAVERGYSFNKDKIDWDFKIPIAIGIKIKVTSEQINYERKHLLSKLKIRDIAKYSEMISAKEILPHPMFEIVKGEIEDWEIIN
ncbi:MAG: pyrimidine dimer DNA glycosylase/endonuclease V [Saprospiraceae bacterium]|nr:pyrimidine dimer DNA glycosylase/endonuclease V [Saprospiraceae bacterium]